MEKEKVVKVSKLLGRLADKCIYFLLAAVMIIGGYMAVSSDNVGIHSQRFIFSFIILAVMAAVGLGVAYWIRITGEDVAQKYEEEVFRKEARRAWLTDQHFRVCELMKFPDEKLAVLASMRLITNVVLDLNNVKIALSIPRKNYTGQELREALQREKEQLEAQMAELVLPEKPKKYLKWEKYFKLNAVQTT